MAVPLLPAPRPRRRPVLQHRERTPMTGPTRPPTGPGARSGPVRPRQTGRPRLLGDTAVPRRTLDPGTADRNRLLRPLVPARRTQPPAFCADVTAGDPPDGVDGRDRPGGRPQPNPRAQQCRRLDRRGARTKSGWWTDTGRSHPSGQARADDVGVRCHRGALHAARTRTHPTPASPLRVLIVGDSVGLDLGQPLVNALGGFGDVTTYLDGRIDTGLSRPDYFNWPAELNVDLANQQPQLVVVMIGANDAQGLVTQNGSIRFGQPGLGPGLLGPGGRLHRRGQRTRGPTCCGWACRRCRTPS